MNRRSMRISNLQCSSMSGRWRLAVFGASRAAVPGWLARVEPNAHSCVPFSMRSSPMRSTKDKDSHRGPCNHQGG
jgi:hypothetical protein